MASASFLVGIYMNGPTAPAFGENYGPDPVSLEQLTGIGGGDEEPLAVEEVAARSDLAVTAVVRDVKRSRLNTPDGRMPSAEHLEDGGIRNLVVLTEVVVDVQEAHVLSERGLGMDITAPLLVKQRKPKTITITVAGGAMAMRLSQSQARALHVLEVVEQFDAREVDGDTSRPPDVETEVPASGPVEDFTFGTSPSIDLTEGETVVLFLSETEISAGKPDATMKIVSPIHSAAVIHRVGSAWRVATSDGPVVDPVQVIEQASK